jgi:hypothetical protein
MVIPPSLDAKCIEQCGCAGPRPGFRWMVRREERPEEIVGALSTAEAEELERARKSVAFELDEKIKEKPKGAWRQRINPDGGVRWRQRKSSSIAPTAAS